MLEFKASNGDEIEFDLDSRELSITISEGGYYIDHFTTFNLNRDQALLLANKIIETYGRDEIEK